MKKSKYLVVAVIILLIAFGLSMIPEEQDTLDSPPEASANDIDATSSS